MIEPILHSLFPTPILHSKLDRDFTNNELRFFSETKKNSKRNIGNTISKDRYVLKNPELKELNDFFNSQLKIYCENIIEPKDDIEIRITQSWLNFSEKNEFHHVHEHPNSYISGVFYIETNEDDKLFFYNRKYNQISVEKKNFNIWNSDIWWLPSKAYELYLFPSNLTHSVEKVKGSKIRTSLSFNTFITGKMGSYDESTELVL